MFGAVGLPPEPGGIAGDPATLALGTPAPAMPLADMPLIAAGEGFDIGDVVGVGLADGD
jgi:hypothetical protein